ncbi:tRNA 2-selenouridine(34) synthase MnmH [Flavisolibacter nicotianae]|uniref:tRNA 2-selenouridine(34) synthase MnmH n=1 Tax=Flavisolibacter nicotianae TaxID=2364882 RepID=UPI0013C4B37E|nr:tRNA 2-selenouridine(34) synthase MnmH [Flavisolibacter nicotianae]
MRRVAIHEFLEGCNDALLLDVRSPAEYNHAHLPGAISFPLFTDEERKVVGTTYKQVSRQAAIKIGLDYFGPKMRPMVEQVEALLSSRQQAISKDANGQLPIANRIFLYCWRGGMRSGAIGWLLNLYGFNVTVLTGGYKAFRNHVLKTFEQPYNFKILGGYTGSGKTEVLQELRAMGEKVICLESVASHKGSAFGNINMPPQPTQEMFENLLSHELRAVSQEPGEWPVLKDEPETTPNPKLQTPNPSIWLEDESQRIGTVNLPNSLWQAMRTSPLYFLEIPFEERLKHITEEYSQCSKEKLADAIERIKKRLGGLETKNALRFLAEENYTECFRILLSYYDKHYLKGLHNREELSTLLTKIPCETVTEKNAVLLSQAQVVS